VSAPDPLEAAFVALVDDVVEVLHERTGTDRGDLLREHERSAYELLAVDVEHSGDITLSAKALASLLVPPTPAPVVLLAEPEPRKEGKPAGWLEPDVFERCLGRARAALVDRGDG
jgi:hypothetical protein